VRRLHRARRRPDRRRRIGLAAGGVAHPLPIPTPVKSIAPPLSADRALSGASLFTLSFLGIHRNGPSDPR
jgi:hypothetical protein